MALVFFSGCRKEKTAEAANPPATRLTAESFHPVADPAEEEPAAFRQQVYDAFNERRFDDLEKAAAEACASKKVFASGSWKIAQFHVAVGCPDDAPADVWPQRDEIYRAWIAAEPQSATARVAYGEFLTDYAWQARGTGYANTVTNEGWMMMRIRLDAARKVLSEAHELPTYDQMYGVAMLTVALGQEWSAENYEALLAELKAKEPTFWGYQRTRAYSLLPRWYGEPGDWEAYAEKEAADPKGLGDEIYARIVLNLGGYYHNVFTETKASWPKTRAGLELMMKRYPHSTSIVNEAAALATRAQDREFAGAMFTKMGTDYVSAVWGNGGRVAAARAWAESR